MKQSGQAGFKGSPMSEVGTDLKNVKCAPLYVYNATKHSVTKRE